jgi:hypothetical protein
MKDLSEQPSDVEYDCLRETVRATDHTSAGNLSATSVKSGYNL